MCRIRRSTCEIVITLLFQQDTVQGREGIHPLLLPFRMTFRATSF